MERIKEIIYIKDLTSAIIKAVFLNQKENITLNIGSGIGFSVNEILMLIEKITGKKLDTKHLNPRSFDVNYNVLDICASLKVLNWYPDMCIEEGIKKTGQWMKKRL